MSSTVGELRCLQEELLARKRRMTETLLTFREAQQKANILFSELRELMNFDQDELDVFKKGDEDELHRLGERIKQVHKFDKLDLHKISNPDILLDSFTALSSTIELSFEIKNLARLRFASERKKPSWQKSLETGADVFDNFVLFFNNYKKSEDSTYWHSFDLCRL